VVRTYIAKRFYVDLDKATLCFEDAKKKVRECDRVELDRLYDFLDVLYEYFERKTEEEEEELAKEEEEEVLGELMEEREE